MDWHDEGLDWPNRRFSRHVQMPEMRWHVQEMGARENSTLLLLHGSGSTTHSMAGLMAELSPRYHCVAVDLPGHGFSSPMRKPSLERVATRLIELLEREAIYPSFLVGHSAGAAIAMQMMSHHAQAAVLEKTSGMVSINGAFYPFAGAAGHVFPVAARLLFVNPYVPRLFSFAAQTFGQVESLMASTGSKVSDESMECYRRALASPQHIEGTLALMANWDLRPMPAQLKAFPFPLLQIIGENDGTISPKAARETHTLVQNSQIESHGRKGHLVHEEVPNLVAVQIETFVSKVMNPTVPSN